MEQSALFHSFKKHLLRSKDGKDSLTRFAPMEAEQRNQQPSNGVRGQGEPHSSLERLMVFKWVQDTMRWALSNDHYSGETLPGGAWTRLGRAGGQWEGFGYVLGYRGQA